MTVLSDLIDRMIEAGMSPGEAGSIAAEIYSAGVASASVRKEVKSGATRMANYRDRREAIGLPRVFMVAEFREKLIARDGDQCIYCESTGGLVVDHIHPIFLGGCDDVRNLGLACRPCNGRKAGRALSETGMSIVVETARHAHEGYKPRTLDAHVQGEQCAPSPRTTTHTVAHVRGDAVLPIDTKIKNSKKQNSERASRGSRIDPNWTPNQADWQIASDEGFTGTEIDREALRFRDYWSARAGGGGVKLDWSATWRNWVRTAAEKLGKTPRKPGPVASDSSFIAKMGSEELEAWDAYGKQTTGKTFPRNREGGWRFPTRWPPGYVPSEKTYEIATPKLRSMQ